MKKKANDYLREWQDANSRLTNIENNVNKRLKELVINYPNAIIGEIKLDNETTQLHAKNTLTDQYITTLGTDNMIHYINKIEEYVLSMSDVKQLNWKRS